MEIEFLSVQKKESKPNSCSIEFHLMAHFYHKPWDNSLQVSGSARDIIQLRYPSCLTGHGPLSEYTQNNSVIRLIAKEANPLIENKRALIQLSRAVSKSKRRNHSQAKLLTPSGNASQLYTYDTAVFSTCHILIGGSTDTQLFDSDRTARPCPTHPTVASSADVATATFSCPSRGSRVTHGIRCGLKFQSSMSVVARDVAFLGFSPKP